MRISFEEIPPEGRRISVKDISWFPGRELKQQGKISTDVFVKRQGERIFFEGAVSLHFQFECDRCLVQYEVPECIEFKLNIELNDAKERAKDYICNASEMDTMFVAEPVIDIFNVLRQQVFLAVPLKRLCTEDCQGLCTGCGVNLNSEKCLCRRDKGPSPFGVLSGMKLK